MEKINIVWLKRDLRTQDHAPLDIAEKSNIPYIIIYIFDSNILKHPDVGVRHLQFIYQSIIAINKKLKVYNKSVNIFYGESLKIIKFLQTKFQIKSVFSYQESGIKISWDRDKAISKHLNSNEIIWKEFQQNGVIRGLENRRNWAKLWNEFMSQPIILNKFSKKNKIEIIHPFELPKKTEKIIKNYSNLFQPAGEKNAFLYLNSFLQNRGKNYQRNISKPTESRTSCSRISPFISWGNLSIRQVFQYINRHPNTKNHKKAFSAMLTRLHWHCHFIQKFEMECKYETHCINAGYELLKRSLDDSNLKAWRTATTGYPLVDASMRALDETGWINFRMRALLVSFLTFNLDQDWRNGVYHMARLFLDYDPGIHYPQFQMQAGTTGVNTIRLYNPIKNSTELDPEGIFIKKWIPELQNIPIKYIHEPWKMSVMEQAFYGVIIGKDYPIPVIDLQESSRISRKKVWGHRKHPLVQKENKRILKRHVLRR
ncbi:MAG: deoxyribodipyrimidine photolyase [Flavobacteriaceae bacterium]|nr:deoxyribodipyrimidine photolyase [Flavobacteriaceae bacterium]|tara:strand:- start:1989 stop:3440 length:1452 start_codon:yes stop_codon:yes gene_type:complete